MWILVIIGTFVWSVTMVKSGWLYSYGMGFWGPNGHDGIWHIALAGSLSQGSWQMPTFAGELLKNYHIGFDLLLALLHKVTFVPIHNLYFQILPPILAFLIGFLTYKAVLLWRDSKREAAWSAFFVYFGGNFGWIVTLLRGEGIAGESMFWSQQAASTLINPPFAASLVFLLLGMILLIRLQKKFSLFTFTFLLLTFALLGQIKVYGGILALGGLGVLGLFQLAKQRKITYLLLFVLSSILALALFIPLNRNSTSLVVFQPFWFLETMMAISDRVGWEHFYNAMITYRWGNIWHKAIPAYTVAFLIFLIGNLGTRIFAGVFLWELVKKRKLDYIAIFILTIFVLGIAFPMLFLQEGTPWNTIQFFYYSLFSASILSGIGMARFSKNKAILVAVLLFTLPTTYATLKHYLPNRPPAKLSYEESEALSYLSKQEEGIVLTYPFDRYLAEQAVANPPRPLYLYESTAYVGAFSQKPVFLENEVNLTITDYPWRQRREKIEGFLETLDQKAAYSFLRDNNISYIYWIGSQRARLGETQLGIEQIFENREVKIYKVQ